MLVIITLDNSCALKWAVRDEGLTPLPVCCAPVISMGARCREAVRVMQK